MLHFRRKFPTDKNLKKGSVSLLCHDACGVSFWAPAAPRSSHFPNFDHGKTPRLLVPQYNSLSSAAG